tara:strand:+ start:1105 stop:2070 length:966 start_codon:yes stop_codon:yes gene_type:complete
MEPEYQRAGNIWSLEDKQFLIDSILNEYDVPKLYLADFTTIRTDLNEESLQFSVIDGKQRIEAIFGFISNEFTLNRNFIYQRSDGINIGGLYYKDLVRRYDWVAAVLEEYPMPIMHVVTDELDKINELFVRLNKGSTLTGAEKRNAMIGPIPKYVCKIVSHDFFSSCVKYQTKRGQNLNAAAKILLFELHGDVIDTKKVSLDRMVDEFRENHLHAESAFENVMNVLQKMVQVFGIRDPLLGSQGPLPVYYWFIRNTDVGELHLVREFLEQFAVALRAEGSSFSQNELDDYQAASRSINDGWSHRRRVDILQREFDAWVQRH